MRSNDLPEFSPVRAQQAIQGSSSQDLIHVTEYTNAQGEKKIHPADCKIRKLEPPTEL